MATRRARIRGFARDRPLLAPLLVILSVEIVGASGSVFTIQGLGGWYESLTLPAFAPPNWIFGPVWTTLFALIGAAVWPVWCKAPTQPRAVRLAIAVFVMHFAVNLGWSAAFFGLQNVGLGLAVILLLLALIVATIWAFDRVDRRAAVLLVPYLLWVSFATYLNYQIWVLN